jgi:predicted DNA-binding transcriptional regulator YafY
MVWAPFGREPRAERVGDVLEVRMVSAAAPPDDFDLAAFWEEAGRRRAPVAAFRATLRVSARLLPLLERRFGVAADHGRVTLPFPSIEEARTAVLGWGGAVEVLAPQALRRTVADFAARAAAVYVPNAVPAGRSSVGNDAAGSL